VSDGRFHEADVERLGIYDLLFGKRRRFLAVAAATIGLSSIAAGCGRDEVAYMAPAPPPAPATTGAATTTVPAATVPSPTPAPAAPAEPAVPATPPAAQTAPKPAGDEEALRVPARFTVTGARLTPGNVTVPAFLGIELVLVSADAREHTLGIATPGGGVRMRVGAGETARLTLPGLQPGEYLVSLDGAATDATLLAAQ
jgi:hypothetical protein